jgi:hypothetical protein
MPRPKSEVLATITSDLIFRVTGFGPSRSICEPFAEQVLAEADAVNFNVNFNLP